MRDLQEQEISLKKFGLLSPCFRTTADSRRRCLGHCTWKLLPLPTSTSHVSRKPLLVGCSQPLYAKRLPIEALFSENASNIKDSKLASLSFRWTPILIKWKMLSAFCRLLSIPHYRCFMSLLLTLILTHTKAPASWSRKLSTECSGMLRCNPSSSCREW